ncbi:putative sugar O-methyltransferase, partial [bacterium]|nr:putative sugar O-methyltransferase [bacterium]
MIDEIFARCPEMFAAARDRAEEDWFAAKAHTHERHKFMLFPSIEVLARFRDYHIGGIGLEPIDHMVKIAQFETQHFEKIQIPSFSRDDQKLVFRVNLNTLNAVVRSLQGVVGTGNYSKKFRDVLLENMVDTPSNGGFFGNIKIFERKIFTSGFAIRTAHRTAIASELYNRESTTPPLAIMELGGGFGKSLADLIRIFPTATALYVDLPVNMAVAAHYFDGRFPGRVNLVWRDTDAVRAGMINVVAPWLIDKIDLQIDLMINFLSMHHMPQRTMDFYFARLIAPKVRFLYHENRLVPRRADEGEGFLEKIPKRSEMDILHSVQFQWGTTGQ